MEHPYAADRKRVRLADLKLVDLVRTGDDMRFTYKGRDFMAKVTREGRIAAAASPAHSRADPDETTAGLSAYRTPSNFTLDCVDAYWYDERERTGVAEVKNECRTNPSGYERIHLVRTGDTLNALRDEYMLRYTGQSRADVASVQTPDDVNDLLEDSRHKRQRGDATPQTPPPLPPPARFKRSRAAMILGSERLPDSLADVGHGAIQHGDPRWRRDSDDTHVPGTGESRALQRRSRPRHRCWNPGGDAVRVGRVAEDRPAGQGRSGQGPTLHRSRRYHRPAEPEDVTCPWPEMTTDSQTQLTITAMPI